MVELNQELEVAVAKLMGYTAQQGWGITERGEAYYDDTYPHTYGNGWQVVAPDEEFQEETDVFPTEEEAWGKSIIYSVLLAKNYPNRWYTLPFNTLTRHEDGTYTAAKGAVAVHCSNPARAVLECVWRDHLGETGMVEVDYDAMYQAWVDEGQRIANERRVAQRQAEEERQRQRQAEWEASHPLLTLRLAYTLEQPSAETQWHPLGTIEVRDLYQGVIDHVVANVPIPEGYRWKGYSFSCSHIHHGDNARHAKLCYAHSVNQGDVRFVFLRIWEE